MSEQPGYGSAGTPSTPGHGFSAISAGPARDREEGEGTSGLHGTGSGVLATATDHGRAHLRNPVPAQAEQGRWADERAWQI